MGVSLSQMNKPILVALDDSESSVAVLEAAVKLAQRFGARLVLCRVIALPAVQLSPDGLPVAGDLQAELERKAKADLSAIAPRVPAGIATSFVTVFDVPWEGICEAARKQDASLIVIGSHTYGGLDRILGTTAAKVVNHADRTVMVVRGDFTA